MKRVVVIIIIFLLIYIIGSFWWRNGLLSPNPSDKSQIIFVVNQGENVRDITYKLKKENLIKDPVAFFLYLKERGIDNKIQAGDFRLSPSLNAEQVVEILQHGTLDKYVTIPEGKRAEEIADILQQKIPSYQLSWRSILNNHEGYLFPDTYLIPRAANLDIVLQIFKTNFDQKYKIVQQQQTTAFSQQDVVTIASLVEREAKLTDDQPIVASVIINRLKLGMPLQIDATVQYA